MRAERARLSSGMLLRCCLCADRCSSVARAADKLISGRRGRAGCGSSGRQCALCCAAGAPAMRAVQPRPTDRYWIPAADLSAGEPAGEPIYWPAGRQSASDVKRRPSNNMRARLTGRTGAPWAPPGRTGKFLKVRREHPPPTGLRAARAPAILVGAGPGGRLAGALGGAVCARPAGLTCAEWQLSNEHHLNLHDRPSCSWRVRLTTGGRLAGNKWRAIRTAAGRPAKQRALGRLECRRPAGSSGEH